jgi:hypothetical protein
MATAGRGDDITSKPATGAIAVKDTPLSTLEAVYLREKRRQTTVDIFRADPC